MKTLFAWLILPMMSMLLLHIYQNRSATELSDTIEFQEATKGNDPKLFKFDNKALQDVEIKKLSLENSSWFEANLTRVKMLDSNFANASFQNIYLNQVQFTEVNFASTLWRGCHILSSFGRNSSFAQAKMQNCNFSHFTCIGCDLRGTDFSDSVFILTDFTDSKFNDSTKFPWSKSHSLKMGMTFVD